MMISAMQVKALVAVLPQDGDHRCRLRALLLDVPGLPAETAAERAVRLAQARPLPAWWARDEDYDNTAGVTLTDALPSILCDAFNSACGVRLPAPLLGVEVMTCSPTPDAAKILGCCTT